MLANWRKATVATLCVVAVCALFAVTLVSEVDTEPSASVLEEADATSEAALYEWTAELKAGGPSVIKDPVVQDDSAAEAVKKLQHEATKGHQARQEARHNLREQSAQAAATAAQKSVDALGEEAKKLAASAAEKTATSAVKTGLPVQPAAAIGVGSKLGLLNQDDKLLKAAVAKAEKQLADQKATEKAASDKYHSEVAADVATTKTDFQKLKENLDAFKDIGEKERKTQLELQQAKATKKRLRSVLDSKVAQLKRMQDRQTDAVQKAKDKVAKSKDELKVLLQQYKDKLAGLNDKLTDVKKTTDINEEIATRISAARDVVKKQVSKMKELRGDVGKLDSELQKTKSTTKDLNEHVADKRQALHLADSAYTKLTLQSEDLQAKLAAPAPQVTLKTSRGDNKKSTQKTVKKVVQALGKVAEDSKPKILEAAKKSAVEAAEKAVRANSPPLPPPKVAGINSALKDAGQAISGLNLTDSKSGDSVSTDTIAEQLVQEPNVNGLDKAIDDADQALAEVHLSTFDSTKVHQAELLAHVAHTLFEKAMVSGKADDKAAAEAAMQKAMHAHIHLTA